MTTLKKALALLAMGAALAGCSTAGGSNSGEAYTWSMGGPIKVAPGTSSPDSQYAPNGDRVSPYPPYYRPNH